MTDSKVDNIVDKDNSINDFKINNKEKKLSEKTKDVLLIENRYYDTKALASIHPGGELFVLLCNRQDATTIFNSYHRRSFPHNRYEKFLVSKEQVSDDIKEEIKPNTQNFDVYWELCEKTRPVLSKTKGFAPLHYYFKVSFFLLVAFFLDFFLPLFVPRPIWASMLLGLFFAFIGLNVQHDANHGAISSNFRINRLLGLSQDYIGGSSIMWMFNHNTIHHVHSNDTSLDHDLAIPFLRLHQKVPWKVPYVIQQMYFLFLEIIFGPIHCLYNIISIWSPTPEREKVYEEYRRVSQIFSVLFPIRLALLCIHLSFAQGVLNLIVMYNVGGTYLAFFFLISHNYHGVRKEDIDSLSSCFVRNQSETSSNVGGEILCQMNGGLNYQIEHHLFPRVNHNFYPKISPIVREVCKKHNIRYTHFNTIWDNFVSTFLHLKELGMKPSE